MCQTKGDIGELCSKSWGFRAQEEEKEASKLGTSPRGGERNPLEQEVPKDCISNLWRDCSTQVLSSQTQEGARLFPQVPGMATDF